MQDLHTGLDVRTTQRNIQIARQKILKLIEDAIEKRLRDAQGLTIHFPTQPENYLSFCDLVEVSLHPERKIWHTFILQDDDNVLETLHIPNSGPLPLWKIRKSIKKQLSESLMASVQMELQTTNEFEKIFLRIASTEPSEKRPTLAGKRLLSTKPTYLVYFPGEPYFYADSASPTPSHCQVR